MPRLLNDGPQRCLPQGCQIEKQYTQGEWNSFLDCLLRSFDQCECLDNEYSLKTSQHGVQDDDVRRAIRPSAQVAAYVDRGHGRVALWDGEETGLLVIARESNGKIFNAYEIDDFGQMLRAREDVRWLHH